MRYLIDMELSARIRERLDTLNMTQAELCRRAEVPQSTLNSILRRGTRSSPHLIKLAAALQTSPAFLAGEVDDPSEDAVAAYFTGQEIDWMELLRAIAPRERDALLTLARGLARAAERPTVHSRQAEYRAG